MMRSKKIYRFNLTEEVLNNGVGMRRGGKAARISVLKQSGVRCRKKKTHLPKEGEQTVTKGRRKNPGKKRIASLNGT